MYCPSCGIPVAPSQRFCARCRSSLEASAQPADAPVAQDTQSTAIVEPPSTVPLEGMPAITSAHPSARRALSMLGLSWGALFWAGLSVYLRSSNMRLPYAVELLMVLSGAIAFVGGCLGAVYLVSAARTRQTITAGVLSTLGNFAYLWWYVEAVYHR